MRFESRVALVTGGAHGIGLAVVKRLRQEGARVGLADIEAEAAEQAARSVGPDHVQALACDVHRRESVDAAVAACVERFGRLDVLVTVAGGAEPLPGIADLTDEDWTRELDLNLTGTMRCIRAAVPHLRSGASSAVVLVGSVNGLAAFGNEPYSSAKAGLSMLARNLAVELGPTGIRVNVVAPGTVRTRVWDGQPGGADRLLPFYPLGRVGEAGDIAAAVAFLASDDAAWITGVTLPVDGGLLAGPRQLLQVLEVHANAQVDTEDR